MTDSSVEDPACAHLHIISSIVLIVLFFNMVFVMPAVTVVMIMLCDGDLNDVAG